MVKRKTHKKRRLVYKKRRLTRNKKRKLTRTIQHGGLSSEEIQTLSQDPYVQLYINFIFNKENFNNFILNTSITKRASDTVDFLKIIHTHTDIKKFKKEINYENGWVILLNEIIKGGYFYFPDKWWEKSNLINREDKEFLENLIKIQVLPYLSSHPEKKSLDSNFYLTDTHNALEFIKNNREELSDPKKKSYYLTNNDYGKFISLFYNRFILGVPGKPAPITMNNTLNASDSDSYFYSDSDYGSQD